MALFKLTTGVFTGGNVFNLRSCLMPHLNSMTTAGLKQQTSQPLSIPEKPKKPLTPYFKFQGQIRNKIMERNPNIKIIEVTKLVSEEWKKIGEAEKKRLENEYAKEKEIYAQNVKKYHDELTPEAIEFLRKEKEVKKQKKEKREMKKLFKETGKPKKPGNSFYLFIKDNIDKKEYEGKSYMSLIPTFAKLWATLEETEVKTGSIPNRNSRVPGLQMKLQMPIRSKAQVEHVIFTTESIETQNAKEHSFNPVEKMKKKIADSSRVQSEQNAEVEKEISVPEDVVQRNETFVKEVRLKDKPEPENTGGTIKSMFFKLFGKK
ncbi:hypothetical protein M8J77_022450 [Diaphorina citri]|nr:hypothetical protein M8J77_022450 [Diaphorina citri]